MLISVSDLDNKKVRRNALYLAVTNGYSDITELLLSHITPTSNDFFVAIREAISRPWNKKASKLAINLIKNPNFAVNRYLSRIEDAAKEYRNTFVLNFISDYFYDGTEPIFWNRTRLD